MTSNVISNANSNGGKALTEATSVSLNLGQGSAGGSISSTASNDAAVATMTMNLGGGNDDAFFDDFNRRRRVLLGGRSAGGWRPLGRASSHHGVDGYRMVVRH